MSNLVIVESPAKAKTIGKYLGPGYEVTASLGHIRDLPSSQLGVNIEKNYAPIYINIEGKGKLIRELKERAQKSERVYLATDPDREGEAISWHLAKILGLDVTDANRVTFGEITRKGVQEGMNAPRCIDLDLFNAQQARRILDRLVGYKLSPFLWKTVRRGLSAGRVQSVAVRILMDREKEIEAFIPEEFWNIDALLAQRETDKTFSAHFVGTADGHKLSVNDAQQAKKIEQDLNGARYIVSSIKKGHRKKSPQPPFITSTLQQEASSRLGFTAKRTMRAAQTLYEGVDIEGAGTIGLITYMRTDSLRLSDEAIADAKDFIDSHYGKQYTHAGARKYKSKSATEAQDAHEAIRPSVPAITPEQAERTLSGDEAKLYRLIWSRFMASQMADCEQDTVAADIDAAGYRFHASGYVVTFDGFTVLYDDTDNEKEKSGGALPALVEGEELQLNNLKSEQKFTQPPARYTEATLIRALEENGIGRPSTYAPTISTIIDRGYVERDGKKLIPTVLGRTVNEVMLQQFPNIVDITFSADMEHNLDRVEAGKAQWQQVIDEFYKNFAAELAQAEEHVGSEKIKVPDEETDEECELCGRKMVIKSGRYGKFLACPGYPDCKNTRRLMKFTKGNCPECGKRMVEKRSAKGRVFYGCEGYPACNYLTWDIPTGEKCEKCGSTLFKKGSKLYCAKAGCDFEKVIPKKGK